MIGPTDPERRERAREFGELLRSAMRKAGYHSERARSGVDPQPLEKRLKVSYEMARRYIAGLALPDAPVRREIETWLHLTPYALEPGGGRAPSQAAHKASAKTSKAEGVSGRNIDHGLLSLCIEAVQQAVQEQGIELTPDETAEVIADLYDQSAKAGTINGMSVMKLIIDVVRGKSQ